MPVTDVKLSKNSVSEPVARFWCRLRGTSAVPLYKCAKWNLNGDPFNWHAPGERTNCTEADHVEVVWHEGRPNGSHIIYPPAAEPLDWLGALAVGGYEVHVGPPWPGETGVHLSIQLLGDARRYGWGQGCLPEKIAATLATLVEQEADRVADEVRVKEASPEIAGAWANELERAAAGGPFPIGPREVSTETGHRVLCDGCNVREPWEHRCHSGRYGQANIMVRGERELVVCQCEECAEARMRSDAR